MSAMTEFPEPMYGELVIGTDQHGDEVLGNCFSTRQMREYGELCRKQAMEEAAKVCELDASAYKALTKNKFLTQNGKTLHEGMYGGATNCAKAIRSLK